jgi:ADP-heptose:LPS heptosyltransferase
LGVPMVVLFGPGEFDRYRPYGNEGETIIIRKEVQCSPCFKRTCRSRKCMRMIKPEEAFQATRQLLGEGNAQA